MRLQARFEISEGVGDLIARYNREQHNPNTALQAIDRGRSDMWMKKNAAGYYLEHSLHFFIGLCRLAGIANLVRPVRENGK